MKKATLILSLLLATVMPTLLAQSSAQILKKSEELRRGVESSKAEMTMTIVRPKWTRTMSMKAWSKGDDYSLIVVTAPASDEGSATLKRKKEVWNYVPRIDRTIKLSRSMMSQNWMGSDLTNDDLVREVSLITDYDHQILGEEMIEGRTCWKIELIPHDDVPVVWGKVIMFIDQQDYLQMRTEFYDEDLILTNVMQASNVKKLGGRTFAAKMEIIPVDDEGHRTVLEYTDIQFDLDVSETFFSTQNMKRVR